MTRGDIEDGVIQTLKNETPNLSPGLTDRLVEDLGMDSLDVVETTMALEEGFGVEISDEEAERWENVTDMVDALVRHEPHDFDETRVLPF